MYNLSSFRIVKFVHFVQNIHRALMTNLLARKRKINKKKHLKLLRAKNLINFHLRFTSSLEFSARDY